MNILPIALAAASALRQNSPTAEVVDPTSPLGGLTQPKTFSGLQYPSDIRNDNFYTIFRVYERSTSFNTPGRLAVSGSGEKLGEIILPLPPNLGTSYGVDYGTESLGAIQSSLSAATSAAKPFIANEDYDGAMSAALGSLSDSATDGKGLDTLEGWKNLAKNAGIGAVRQLMPTGIEAGLGVAKNPYQAIVFQSPKFRTHSFAYSLFARNREESFAIQGMINKFKESMMPEFPETTGLYFKYPKVFEIEYHVGNANNPFVHKISTSALMDFQVSYHGEGTPSYFDAEVSPAPTSVKISMTFQELNFMTAEMVRMGY